MLVDILGWQDEDTNLLHQHHVISSLGKKRKVYQERKYFTRRQRRKLPNNCREEKSLKDAGQFLGCKKVL